MEARGSVLPIEARYSQEAELGNCKVPVGQDSSHTVHWSFVPPRSLVRVDELSVQYFGEDPVQGSRGIDKRVTVSHEAARLSIDGPVSRVVQLVKSFLHVVNPVRNEKHALTSTFQEFAHFTSRIGRFHDLHGHGSHVVADHANGLFLGYVLTCRCKPQKPFVDLTGFVHTSHGKTDVIYLSDFQRYLPLRNSECPPAMLPDAHGNAPIPLACGADVNTSHPVFVAEVLRGEMDCKAFAPPPCVG